MVYRQCSPHIDYNHQGISLHFERKQFKARVEHPVPSSAYVLEGFIEKRHARALQLEAPYSANFNTSGKKPASPDCRASAPILSFPNRRIIAREVVPPAGSWLFTLAVISFGCTLYKPGTFRARNAV